MKKIGLVLAVMLLFFTTFPAGTKFVVVDLQKVINDSKAGQSSISQLKNKFLSSEQSLKNQELRIQTLRNELQQSSL